MSNDNNYSPEKLQGSNAIGLPSTEDLDELIELDALDYDAVRKDCAKRLKISLATLDKVVSDHRRKRQQEAKSASRPLLQGWKSELILNAKGLPTPSLNNAIVAFRGAPIWKGVLAFDELAHSIIAVNPPPWERGHNDWKPQPWSDAYDTLATAWLERQGIHVGTLKVRQAVQVVARDAPFHPVRDYLRSLKWDGVGRVGGFATTYLGAIDTPYHSNISRCSFVGAVARIEQPGCQSDYVPVLEGPQGLKKSSGLRVLFDPWFTDDLSGMDSKDAKMEMQGVWGVEIAELASMAKREVEAIKAFISRRVDRFRPSYGHNVIESPRQATIWGTTNRHNWQKDDTGGRRFWPIRCTKIDLDALKRDRDQLWAEAMHLYRAGIQWWLTPDEEALAKEAQDERRTEHPWEVTIRQYIGRHPDVSVQEILGTALDIPVERRDQAKQNQVAQILQMLGWERYRVTSGPRPRPYRYRPSSVGE